MFALTAPFLPFTPWPGPRLPSPGRWLPWRVRPMELRIDVQLPSDRLDADLDDIERRMNTSGDALNGLLGIGFAGPGLVLRYREADGEHYVYVEDLVRGRLAGYTVFNRLIEVGRRADPHLRAPHSRYAPDYQRRGLATAVYEWGLGAGLCLMSGARQSAAAHGLWCALARRHELHYVHVENKTLRYLGSDPRIARRDDLHTRLLMLGKGWTLPRLMQATGMRAQG